MSSSSRRLLVSLAQSDAPTPADRERIRLALAARLGGGSPPPDGGSAAAGGARGPSPAGHAAPPAASPLAGLVGVVGAASVAALAVAAFFTARSGPVPVEAPRVDPLAQAVEAARAAEAPRAIDPLPSAAAREHAPAGGAAPGGSAAHAVASASPVARALVPSASAPKPQVGRPVIGASPAASGAKASSAGALAEEVELLRRARDATRAGDGERALAVLDDLERRQPDGALVEERRASRIVALCASRRADEGREEARTFLAEMPSSIHAERVRAACGAR